MFLVEYFASDPISAICFCIGILLSLTLGLAVTADSFTPHIPFGAFAVEQAKRKNNSFIVIGVLAVIFFVLAVAFLFI